MINVKFSINLKAIISYPSKGNPEHIIDKITDKLTRFEFNENKTKKDFKNCLLTLVKENVKLNEIKHIVEDIETQMSKLEMEFLEDWNIGKKVKVKFDSPIYDGGVNIEAGIPCWFDEEVLKGYPPETYTKMGKLTREEFEYAKKSREIKPVCCEEARDNIYYFPGYIEKDRAGHEEVIHKEGWVTTIKKNNIKETIYGVSICPYCGSKLP